MVNLLVYTENFETSSILNINPIKFSLNMYGLTALHYIVHKGDMQMTKALLNHRANPLAQDNNGFMPIRRAMLNGRNDLVELLTEISSHVVLIPPQ